MPKPVCNLATGRPYWSKVGRCCCGSNPPGPCRCELNPGCQSIDTHVYHYLVNTAFGNPVYLYSQQVPCCCKYAGTYPRTYARETEVRLNPTGCLVYREVFTGTGNGPGFPVRRLIWTTPSQNSCNGLALTTDDVVPWFNQCVPAPGSLLTNFTTITTIGSYRQTCSLFESQEQFVPSNPPNSPHFGFRTIRTEYAGNYVGCQADCVSCCLPDATCVQTDQAACSAAGGIVLPNCSTCLSVRTGACCDDSGRCTETTRRNCGLIRGSIFHGEGTSCSSIVCPVGPASACCLPSGICVPATASGCQAQQGWHFPGLNCGQVTCQVQPTGACCLPGGGCAQIRQSECSAQGGAWQGENSDCGGAGGQACLSGACCTPTSHGIACTIQTGSSCELGGGTYHGNGTICNPDPCTGRIITLPPKSSQIVVATQMPCNGCGDGRL